MAFRFNNILLFACLTTIVVISDSVEAGKLHRIRDFNVAVPETITQCRMKCLVQFINSEETKEEERTDPCTDRPDCFMCWDFCRILYSERESFGEFMCRNPVLCVSFQNIAYNNLK